MRRNAFLLDGDHVGDTFAAFSFEILPNQYIGGGVRRPEGLPRIVDRWVTHLGYSGTDRAEEALAVMAQTKANQYWLGETAAEDKLKSAEELALEDEYGADTVSALKEYGFDQPRQTLLASGQTDLRELLAALRGIGHIRYTVMMSAENTTADPGEFWKDKTINGDVYRHWKRAELFVQEKYPHRVSPPEGHGKGHRSRLKGDECLSQAPDGNGRMRFVDHPQVLETDNSRFHEVKTGWARTTHSLKCQIRKDKDLKASGAARSAHWHFFPSGVTNTIGTAPAMYSLLRGPAANENTPADINYTIYPGRIP